MFDNTKVRKKSESCKFFSIKNPNPLRYCPHRIGSVVTNKPIKTIEMVNYLIFLVSVHED